MVSKKQAVSLSFLFLAGILASCGKNGSNGASVSDCEMFWEQALKAHRQIPYTKMKHTDESNGVVTDEYLAEKRTLSTSEEAFTVEIKFSEMDGAVRHAQDFSMTKEQFVNQCVEAGAMFDAQGLGRLEEGSCEPDFVSVGAGDFQVQRCKVTQDGSDHVETRHYAEINGMQASVLTIHDGQFGRTIYELLAYE